MSDINIKFILYDDFHEYPIAGNIFLYCFDIDQLGSLIEHNKHCRIILVFKAKHIQELYDIINGHYINEIFILGDCTGLNIKHKKITIINTNEKDLMFSLLCAAARYTHREVIKQQNSENYSVANVLKIDSAKLLKQIKAFL
jgi:hypothetical protein